MTQTSDATSQPLWRSLLFVPVNVPKFVDKAHTRGADGLILDLEDSIAPSEKVEARTMVRDAAKIVGQAGADVVVRINRPWRHAVRDIEASICPEVCAIILPKAEDAGHIRAISEVMAEVEVEQGLAIGHTKLIALIEGPNAYYEMRDIARADPRLRQPRAASRSRSDSRATARPAFDQLLACRRPVPPSQ